jgi:hypothetical protein
MGKPKSSYTLWILGHVVRFLFVLLLIGMITVLLWRVVFSQDPPDGFDQISGNDVLREALHTNGKITVLTQDQVKYTEGADNYAYFNLDYCYFFKEADQVQLLLFYNNSTLEHLAEDRGLAAVPPRGEEIFSLKMTQYLDVTPEDHAKAGENDILTEERVLAPSRCEITTNSLYTFLRYTFDGVDLDADTVVIYLDMCYEGESYGTLRLYHRESETKVRLLSGKEQDIVLEMVKE